MRGEKLSDTEIICTWMEPKPEMPTDDGAWDRAFMGHFLNPWWLLTTTGYDDGDEPIIVARALDLDAIFDVQERLKGTGFLAETDQWRSYMNALSAILDPQECTPTAKEWLHADAPTRIKALGIILRPEVERT